jgi:hypothetical protein
MPDRCPTCRQPIPEVERCACGHARAEHRIDLKVAYCGRGCGVVDPCPCRRYEETT